MKIIEYKIIVDIDDEFAPDTRVSTTFIVPEMDKDTLWHYAMFYVEWFYGTTGNILDIEKIATIGFIEKVEK